MHSPPFPLEVLALLTFPLTAKIAANSTKAKLAILIILNCRQQLTTACYRGILFILKFSALSSTWLNSNLSTASDNSIKCKWSKLFSEIMTKLESLQCIEAHAISQLKFIRLRSDINQSTAVIYFLSHASDNDSHNVSSKLYCEHFFVMSYSLSGWWALWEVIV